MGWVFHQFFGIGISQRIAKSENLSEWVIQARSIHSRHFNEENTCHGNSNCFVVRRREALSSTGIRIELKKGTSHQTIRPALNIDINRTIYMFHMTSNVYHLSIDKIHPNMFTYIFRNYYKLHVIRCKRMEKNKEK